MKPDAMERLAALAASGELTAWERSRFERAARADRSLAKLSAEFATQREWLLALGKEAGKPSPPDGDVERTRAALRKRLASSPGTRGMRWVWVPVGAAMALLALAVLPWSGLRETGLLSLSDVRHAASPAPPGSLLHAPRVTRVEGRIPATSASQASGRSTPRAPSAVPEVELPSNAARGSFASAFARVDEIVANGDGEIRLRLKTRNPNVVIYLFQEEFRESGGEE